MLSRALENLFARRINRLICAAQINKLLFGRNRPVTHVFVSYLREDAAQVDELVDGLGKCGIQVWLDRERIKPGERWEPAIRSAIQDGAFFLACFSRSYADRTRSFMNEELHIAVEELRKRPVDRAWFIPVRLDDCTIPSFKIGAAETLDALQWVDVFANREDAVTRIADTIDPTGRLRKWSGRLRGIMFEYPGEGTGYVRHLFERFQEYDITTNYYSDPDDFAHALVEQAEQWDFAIVDTVGDHPDTGVELARQASHHFPKLVVVLLTRYMDRQHVLNSGISDSVLLKSQTLHVNWLADELNVDIRRAMRERSQITNR